MVHFYEDFLREYDAALRKNRGVWYTPQPVVRFIVRGVDALLRSEFGLRDGLADASRVAPPDGAPGRKHTDLLTPDGVREMGGRPFSAAAARGDTRPPEAASRVSGEQIRVSNQLARVYHADLWGKRREKFAWLDETAFESVPWKTIEPNAPQFFLVPRDNALEEEYRRGFDVSRMFPQSGLGICAKRNELAFQSCKDELREILRDFATMPETALKTKYPRERKESRDRKTRYAIEDIKTSGLDESRIVETLYRLFDFRWTYYTGKSKGFLAFPTYDTLKHL